MLRNFSGFLLALLAFSVCVLCVRETTQKPKAYQSGNHSYTSSDYEQMVWSWETHSSPPEATNKFNEQLRRAIEYREFTPCFDRQGRRIGERAMMYMISPHAQQPVWRILWTQQSEDFSESFMVESTSLSEARTGETIGQEGWKKCIATK